MTFYLPVFARYSKLNLARFLGHSVELSLTRWLYTVSQ